MSKAISITLINQDQRIDKFLLKNLKHVSYQIILKKIKGGEVLVNNQKTTPNYRLKLNDTILVENYDDKENKTYIPISSQKPVQPSFGNFIVFEDDNLLVLDKPWGLASHSDSNNEDSVLKKVQDYYLSNPVLTKKTNGYLPQLCNRLDKETRGLILVAKNQLTHTFINQKIATKEIQKFYLAKITGYFDVPEGLLEDYLTIKENCVKISETKVNTEYVKIQTAYRTLNINHKTNSSIVEIELLTGKKHQIRAQMNFYHHPLINEKKYSRSPNKPTGNLGLISYKLVFNFDNQDKDFGYLSKKVISLDKNKMIKLLESL